MTSGGRTTSALEWDQPPKTKNEMIQKRNALIQRLKETGQYERLRQELYARLLLDDVWSETMQREAREVLQKNNHGQPSQLTLDELSSHLCQQGIEAAPESIAEMTKSRIRESCGMGKR